MIELITYRISDQIIIFVHFVILIFERAMQTDKIQLLKGHYYRMVQECSGRALVMKSQDKDYSNKTPQIEHEAQDQINQIWMIEFIQERNLFQIVHALSTLVIQNFVKDIKLAYGSWKAGQLFNIERCAYGQIPNTFVISQKKDSKNYFYADKSGVLQFGLKEADSPEIRWNLKIAENTSAITKSVIFQNAYTNMTIDVPGASTKAGEVLVQYPVNKRFNQRFELFYDESSNHYEIQNVKSKLVLDIMSQSKKQNAQIIQYHRKNSSNQKWTLQNQGKDLYLIRSVHNPQLFIGIKNKSFKECSQLTTTKSEQFALWRILGQFQKQSYELV